MSRVAVFVDAGYLFAEGSMLLTGSRQDRTQLSLDVAAVVAALEQEATARSGRQLLRIYWYDASRSRRPGPEHLDLAEAHDVKLRLGRINDRGEQKGVDALIIADLVELSRNRAIADAMLLSGDEDLRLAVEQSQQLGVRVHLLGIRETRRLNQSRLLRQEADTHAEWDETVIARFLSHVVMVLPGDADEAGIEEGLEAWIEAFIAELLPHEVLKLSAAKGDTVPFEYDRRLLATGRSLHGRDTLTEAERRALREAFLRLIRTRSSGPPEPDDLALE